jgi:hypothetical protein
MPQTESPKIGYVRVCGGSGEADPRFYPVPPQRVDVFGADFYTLSDASLCCLKAGP